MSLDYNNSTAALVPIPWDALSEEALTGVIEAHLVSELSDQSVEGFNLAEQAERIKQDLRAGAWVLIYDTESDSCRLLGKAEAQAYEKQGIL
ncbi:YheU family protein [Salinispirillum marinum]|uniref:YheU family protein n=1 Tax=Salinispirillum marinum TaxID=1485203 RepID=A0ABV8BHB6_9GAMM